MKERKKYLKRLSASIIAITTLVANTVGLTAEAASVTRIMDNDSIASGYGNENENGAYSYITANYLYNGDARIANSTSNSYYAWTYPSISASAHSCTCKVQAYLNHSNFTDTQAEYWVNLSQFSTGRIGYINQNTAPSGWSTISKTITALPGGDYFDSEYGYVEAAGLSGKNTGADGFMITMNY